MPPWVLSAVKRQYRCGVIACCCAAVNAKRTTVPSGRLAAREPLSRCAKPPSSRSEAAIAKSRTAPVVAPGGAQYAYSKATSAVGTPMSYVTDCCPSSQKTPCAELLRSPSVACASVAGTTHLAATGTSRRTVCSTLDTENLPLGQAVHAASELVPNWPVGHALQPAAPVRVVVTEPGAQGLHALLPSVSAYVVALQPAQRLPPTTAENVPAPQSVQAPTPASALDWPCGQPAHAVAPALAPKWPAVHFVHGVLESVPNCPAGHSVQLVAPPPPPPPPPPPSRSVTLPGWHASQVLWPAREAYVVALHGWHAVEPLASLKVPRGQGSQTPLAALRKLPGAHGSQPRSVMFVGGATSCSPSSHGWMGQHTRLVLAVGGVHW